METDCNLKKLFNFFKSLSCVFYPGYQRFSVSRHAFARPREGRVRIVREIEETLETCKMRDKSAKKPPAPRVCVLEKPLKSCYGLFSL